MLPDREIVNCVPAVVISRIVAPLVVNVIVAVPMATRRSSVSRSPRVTEVDIVIIGPLTLQAPAEGISEAPAGIAMDLEVRMRDAPPASAAWSPA